MWIFVFKLTENSIIFHRSDINNVALPAHSPYWSPPSLANLQNKMREEGMNADDILKDVTSTGTTLESEMVWFRVFIVIVKWY